jgi:hypothetical protein
VAAGAPSEALAPETPAAVEAPAAVGAQGDAAGNQSRPAPAVRVQDLPQPGEKVDLPPADTSAHKESTPPAEGAPPLVPHEEGK